MTSPQRSRQPAQIMAMFALGLVAFAAMVGVVIDGGTLYVQRRTAQNAADAAALAGTRALQQSTVTSTGSIGDAICAYVKSNSFGVTPTATAHFVGTSGTDNLGSILLASNCSGGSPSVAIPIGASGVHVDVTIGPYNTYLAGIVGIRQLTAQASATAQVGVLAVPVQDLTPMAGCGPDMLTDSQHPTPNYNILLSDGSIDPSVYSQPWNDFILEGSHTAQDSNASCPDWNGGSGSAGSSSWKGRVNISGLSGVFTPGPNGYDLPVDTGNTNIDPGVVNTCKSAFGPAGDPTGTTASTSKCYLLVPIAAPINPPNEAHIVTLGCFRLYDGGSGDQKWRGVLVPITTNTCNFGTYQLSWTFGNNFSETQVMLTQ